MSPARFRVGDRVKSSMDDAHVGVVVRAWRSGDGWMYQVRRDGSGEHDWCGAEDSAVVAA